MSVINIPAIPLRKILPKSNSTEILAWNDKEYNVKNFSSIQFDYTTGNNNSYFIEEAEENLKFLPKKELYRKQFGTVKERIADIEQQINDAVNDTNKLHCKTTTDKQQQQPLQRQQNNLLYKVNRKKNYKEFLLKTFTFSCCPWKIPWILLINSLIQIFVHIWKTDDIFKILVFSPFRKKEVWRFITYNFLHIGYTHLILNTFIQLMVALPLETEQGHFKVLIVYFGGVLFGSLAATIFQPTLLMVGSSAGVYSLLISHISNISMNFTLLPHRYLRIICVTILCTSDVIFVISHYFYGNNLEPKISVTAHCAGAIGGLLLGFIVYSSSLSNMILIRTIKYLSFIFCLLAVISAIVYNIYVVDIPKL